MDNIRPYLVKLAGEIVNEHLNSGTDLSTLVAKRAKSASLNLDTAKLLVGLANKEYINVTGKMDFDLANPNEMTEKYYYSDTNHKTASIDDQYNSLYTNQYYTPIYNETPKVQYYGDDLFKKTASILEEKQDITPQLNHFFLTKKANLTEQLAHCYNSTQEYFDECKSTINRLSKTAYTTDEIISSIDKIRDVNMDDIQFIKLMYPNDVIYKEASFKDLYDMTEEFETLSDSLLNLQKAGSALLACENEQKALDHDINELKKAGRVFR